MIAALPAGSRACYKSRWFRRPRMDSTSDRAVADYHALLRDETALAQELELGD
jgi:hypothetical protein